MKNTKRMIGWPGGFALLLAAAFITACSEEEFTREAGTVPGEETLTGVSAELYRPAVGSRIRLSDADATDVLRLRLSQLSVQDVSATLAVDADKLDAYNKERGTEYELFPAENVGLEANGTITVPAGETESPDFTVTLEREGVEKGEYLLPLSATVGSGEQARVQTIYMTVMVIEHKEAQRLDPMPFKVVAYLNTEEMNPLLANEFIVQEIDIWTFESVDKQWLDIEVLRKATPRSVNGHAMLALGPDLQYVLDNRETYIQPVQRDNRKVQICIQGGGTGLGFRNLTDAQIDEFVFQIEKVCTQYALDGINFFDTGAEYDMEGAPEIIPSSYAKLLKATKEALGRDKLVTIACDAESSEELSVAQDGISAGEWVDYAYPGILDEVIDPCTEDALLKPIAGIGTTKYGPLLQQCVGLSYDYMMEQKSKIQNIYPARPDITNVFAIWDMPTNSAGASTEQGPASGGFRIIAEGCSDEMGMSTMLFYSVVWPDIPRYYGAFTKDW